MARNKRKKFIGLGARRIVYDLGNGCVLKVARSKYGRRSNKREVRIFYSSHYPLKKRLGRIIDYDYRYRWVKMKKYYRKFPRLRRYKRKLYRLRSLFRNYGIIPYETVSRKGRPNFKNLRLKNNGEIVVIDYGNFIYRREI